MRIEFNDSDSQVVLIGELTFNDHAAFREMLTRAMRSTGAKIVLDLSRLDFVDSAGLGMLLIARDEAGKGSRSLSLVRPQKQVERVFAVTKFETLFTVTRMDGSGAGRHPGISLWDGASEQSLARALRPPVVYCVEQGLREALLELGGLFHSLGLAVTTRAAFRLPVANAFVEAVDQRLQLDDDLRVRMLTVLHEAVINAVLHGNLGLGSSLRDNLAQMARLQRIIERRLADTEFGGRMVFVEASWTPAMLHLLVRDCGEGFARDVAFGIPEADGRGPRRCGRGLCIIEQLSHSVEYLNNGSATGSG